MNLPEFLRARLQELANSDPVIQDRLQADHAGKNLCVNLFVSFSVPEIPKQLPLTEEDRRVLHALGIME